MINTYSGLIALGAVSAFGIFLLRQFFLTIPRELEDAARIDGCSELRIFYQIILPLCKPALAVLVIITFQSTWNEFLWPLVLAQTDDMRVLQVGLILFQQQCGTEWAYLMAGSTLATIPIVIVFLGAQKYFVRGIALTGIK